MWLLQLALVIAVLTPLAAAHAGPTVPREPRARVEHHVRRVEALVDHFEDVLEDGCPRFSRRHDWERYLEVEVERVVLLIAHLNQAWTEAKETRDDATRQVALAPRRHLRDARALLDKLEDCAEENGASLGTLALWRRIEREVPRRRAQIALPRPPTP